MATGKTDIGWYDAGLNRFVKNDLVATAVNVPTSSYNIHPGEYKTFTTTVTKSGYTPLYVCGYSINEQPVNSGGGLLGLLWFCKVNEVYLSSGTITVTIRGVPNSEVTNDTTSIISDITVYILWVKN